MRFRRQQASLFSQMFNSERVETPIGGLYQNKIDRDAMDFLYNKNVLAQLKKGYSNGYYRFSFDKRKEIYSHVVSKIKKCRPKLRVTLCQEEVAMYKEVPGVNTPSKCNCMVGNW